MLHIQKAGIYLDESAVTVVRCGRDFEKIKFLSASTIAIGPTGVEDALTRALAEAGVLPTEPVTFCLRGDQTFLKYFELPTVFSGAELDRTIRFEARKHTPFAMDELECGFQVLKSKKTYQIFFSGIKRERATAAASTLFSKNLILNAIEPLAISLARLVGSPAKPAADDFTLVVCKEPSGGADWVICKKGVAAVSRYGNYFGEEAFSAELRLILDYFKKNFKEGRIGRVVSCLDESEAPLNEVLLRETGVQPILAASLPVFGGKPVTQEICFAAGSALRGLSWTERPTVNLFRPRLAGAPMKPEAAQILRRENMERFILFQLAGVLIFFALVYACVAFPLHSLEKEVGSLRQKSQASGIAMGETLEEVSDLEQRYVEKLAALKNMSSQRILFTDKLTEIARLIPENTWLDRLEYEEQPPRQESKESRALEIEGFVLSSGEGRDLELVNQFSAGLTKSELMMKGFEQTKILSIKKETANSPVPISRFSLVCRTENSRKGR